MKKLLIIIVILSLINITTMAKLSDETLKTVETLRNKHYLSGELFCADNLLFDSKSIEWGSIEWTQDFLKLWVKDGKLFVETQDGKWFIEMEKVKEEKEVKYEKGN